MGKIATLITIAALGLSAGYAQAQPTAGQASWAVESFAPTKAQAKASIQRAWNYFGRVKFDWCMRGRLATLCKDEIPIAACVGKRCVNAPLIGTDSVVWYHHRLVTLTGGGSVTLPVSLFGL